MLDVREKDAGGVKGVLDQRGEMRIVIRLQRKAGWWEKDEMRGEGGGER